jgi:hypothetical protein
MDVVAQPQALQIDSGSIWEQILTVIIDVRTELILFFLAFLLHQLLFGSAFPRAVKFCRSSTTKKQELPCASTSTCRSSFPAQDRRMTSTPVTGLTLLKSAIQAKDLDNAVQQFKKLLVDASVPTVSDVPKHVMFQLVELACREQRIGVVLSELREAQIPISTEMVNVMLVECARSQDTGTAERVVETSAKQCIKLDSRSYQSLVRVAGSDCKRISQLLKQMQENGIECSHEIATVVLTACVSCGDLELTDELYAAVAACPGGNHHALLGVMRLYAEMGSPQLACNVYDMHFKMQQEEVNPLLHR